MGSIGCARGRCRCASTARYCGNVCIPADGCCQNSDCNEDQICENHVYVAKRCGTGAPCRVFVTSSRYRGDLRTNGQGGGIEGADAKCQERARAGNLSGTYKAWIASTAEASAPANRFTNLDNTGPYVQVDDAGTVVAYDWVDLTTQKGDDDYLRASIDVTEHGTPVTWYAWTNVTPTGRRERSDMDGACNDWTSTDLSDY